jgi:UDP-2-acetamido-2,6-beta-L-arabino-hexul-4-ose reductase
VVRLKDIISGRTLEYYLNSENMEVIDIPPGYSHNIENIDSSDLVFIIWCNEIFDKDNPDTYTLNI